MRDPMRPATDPASLQRLSSATCALCCGCKIAFMRLSVSLCQLQDVMQFTYGAEASLKRRRMQDGSTEYTVVARHNPLTGRIEAETGNEDAEREAALYRECASWCNPVEYEKYLAQVCSFVHACMPARTWQWMCFCLAGLLSDAIMAT